VLVHVVAADGTSAFEECHGCGGAFVDLETLAWAQAHADELRSQSGVASIAGTAAHSLDRYVKCPRCRDVMNRKVFGKRSGVIVDVCRAHGTWFDAGELARALDFVRRGGLEETARREAEEARERKKDPTVLRAEAEARAALIAEAVAEGRAIGRWEGRREGRGSRYGLVDLLRLLLE
jgi:Zn-finger nucleic acid-binding protein